MPVHCVVKGRHIDPCRVAHDDRRFNVRHDSLLKKISAIILTYLPPTTSLTTDLGNYSFPQHRVATDLRPDIVGWDDTVKRLCVVELTVPFETSFTGAAERKTIKYKHLIKRARGSGYTAKLITLEVGSRGMINLPGFTQLKDELKILKKDFSLLLVRLSRIESYEIWCKRNTLPYQHQ